MAHRALYWGMFIIFQLKGLLYKKRVQFFSEKFNAGISLPSLPWGFVHGGMICPDAYPNSQGFLLEVQNKGQTWECNGEQPIHIRHQVSVEANLGLSDPPPPGTGEPGPNSHVRPGANFRGPKRLTLKGEPATPKT